MDLPEDTHLAYNERREAWYADVRKDDKPGIGIAASAEGTGGGVAWEFQITQYDLGGKPCTHIEMFDDAYEAIVQVPELFAALAKEQPGTLEQVRAILNGLGAVDETSRVNPHG